VDKLGFFIVRVQPGGHQVECVRSASQVYAPDVAPSPSPLGVWLRGAWARVTDLPCGDLDEFGRKLARDDHPLLALLDLGIRQLRVPLRDLADPILGERLRLLAARGLRISAFSAGLPGEEQWELLERFCSLLERWELVAVVPLSSALRALERAPLPVALSRVDAGAPGQGGYFSHFPHQGFLPGDPALGELGAPPPRLAGLAFRLPPSLAPWEGLQRARDAAGERGLGAVCHVELPRGSERLPFTDDLAVARRVAEAAVAAAAMPQVPVFLDGLLDKDRGYFPRHGLLDRRANPRLAARVLRHLGPWLAARPPRRVAADRFTLAGGELVICPSGAGPWLDLASGRHCTEAPRAPAILLDTV